MSDRTWLIVLGGAGVLLLLSRRPGGTDILGSLLGHPATPTLPTGTIGIGQPMPTLPVPVTVTPSPIVLAPTPIAPGPAIPLPTASPVPVISPVSVALVTAGLAAGAGSSLLPTVQSAVNNSATVIKAGGAIATQLELPITNLAEVMLGVGVVALVADMVFVILGDEPNWMKAVDVAIDAASIVCLFIPTIGWIIAIVLQIIRFIFHLFGGGGLTHAQRQILETARYAERLHPIFPQIAQAYSPRELLRVLIAWGSGYCGGTHNVAIGTGLHNFPGPGDELPFGSQDCPYHTGPNEGITFDEQAMALATRGQTTDFWADAQVGIEANIKVQFNNQVQNTVTARCAVYAEMAAQGLTLDQMDVVAAEFRRTDRLNRFAAIFGWDSWQAMFSMILQPAWADYVATIPANGTGSLNAFAQSLGYADAIALRDAAFSGYRTVGDRILDLEDRIQRAGTWALAQMGAYAGQFAGESLDQIHDTMVAVGYLTGASTMPNVTFPQYSPDASVMAYLQSLERRLATVEMLDQMQAAQQGTTVQAQTSYAPAP